MQLNKGKKNLCSCSILGNISQENVFYDILEGNNAFLSYKTEKFKKSKKWRFSQGKNVFGPKMAIFPNFFFLGNIFMENVYYDILKQKNAFKRYKKKTFTKSKN